MYTQIHTYIVCGVSKTNFANKFQMQQSVEAIDMDMDMVRVGIKED